MLKRVILFALYVSVALALGLEVGKFPYLVSLQYTDAPDGQLCRGSILTYKLILTAAHCLDVALEQGKNITIVTADGSQRVNVVETHIHPGWTKPTAAPFGNDVAILTVSPSLSFTSTVRPMRISNASVDKFDGKKDGCLRDGLFVSTAAANISTALGVESLGTCDQIPRNFVRVPYLKDFILPIINKSLRKIP